MTQQITRPHRTEIQARFDVAILDAGKAGAWPVTRENAFDPNDEIERQEAIERAARAVMDQAKAALITLARRSAEYAGHVRADQEFYERDLAVLDDLYVDTFGQIGEAVRKARFEIAHAE